MSKKLILLSLEVDVHKTSGPVFNEIQLRALLAGLCAVYSEATIWVSKKNIAVMAVGDNGELLVTALQHFKAKFKRMKLTYGHDAEIMLGKIADGNEWSGSHAADKIIQLSQCARLGEESESIGPVLDQLMKKTMNRLEFVATQVRRPRGRMAA